MAGPRGQGGTSKKARKILSRKLCRSGAIIFPLFIIQIDQECGQELRSRPLASGKILNRGLAWPSGRGARLGCRRSRVRILPGRVFAKRFENNNSPKRENLSEKNRPLGGFGKNDPWPDSNPGPPAPEAGGRSARPGRHLEKGAEKSESKVASDWHNCFPIFYFSDRSGICSISNVFIDEELF